MNEVSFEAPSQDGAARHSASVPQVNHSPGDMPFRRPKQAPQPDVNEAFAALGVAQPLCIGLKAQGYNTPTPIQVRTIPALLQGCDLLGLAQTGTGKTAAFALPILQRLAAGNIQGQRFPRALILVPTRELAVQVGQSFAAYGSQLHLRHAVILGGVSHSSQARALAKGVDIIVATPGRLLDLVNQRHARLDRISHFVLDEADRMLDMGFIRDVQKIVAMLPRGRQSLLFSATMPHDVEHLAASLLREPLRVEVDPPATTAERVEQRVHFVAAADKRNFLVKLLDDSAMNRVLVFTRTKHQADKVARHLGIAAIGSDAIHGNKSQNARQRALENFRNGKSRVLVATDIAARGIDVDGVSHVVNFEMPNDPESYVHRIGRTARAGASGIAISLCDTNERTQLRDVERLTRQKLTVAGEHAPEGSQANRAAAKAEPHRQGRPAATNPKARQSRRRRRRFPQKPGVKLT
ncbi:MAG TPA: DEAD/DEAH box helicase [Rhizomicrobium sp.]|jgi:ATP-dependent RNA helicase RhlE|nr:DEAD/DEAH box helicase [Rhizomicrobium sp.]